MSSCGADMVALCNAAAQRLGARGLRFEQGDVRSVAPPAIDVMIALHACDIATDYAIHTGMRSGASIIMCSPCCHKQMRPQMQSPHPLLPMLQHGMHLGQQAEMVTDGLRALLLEACGYDDPGVRVHLAGAHQQEQDDPGGQARRSRPARASCWRRSRSSRTSTASASSAWRPC